MNFRGLFYDEVALVAFWNLLALKCLLEYNLNKRDLRIPSDSVGIKYHLLRSGDFLPKFIFQVRSTFVCTAWDGWIWACGSETSCEVMRPQYKKKEKWIQAPPMWRRRYR